MRGLVCGRLSVHVVAAACCGMALPAAGGVVFDQISSAQPAFTTTRPGQEVAEDTRLDLAGGNVLTEATFAVLNAGFHSTGRLIATIYANDDAAGAAPGVMLGRASAEFDVPSGSVTSPAMAMVIVPLPSIPVSGERVWTAWYFEVDSGPGNGLGVRQTSGPAAVGSSEDLFALRQFGPPGGPWGVHTEGGASDPRFTYNFRIELKAVPGPGVSGLGVAGGVPGLLRRRRARRRQRC